MTENPLKNELSQYEAFLFDLDGTLLDTLDDLVESVNYALEKHGLPLRTKQEVRSFLGNGIRFLMEKAVGERIASNEERFLPVFQSFRAHYVDHCLDATRPYEGIVEMLRALKEKGFKLAIVSNKLQPAVTELNIFQRCDKRCNRRKRRCSQKTVSGFRFEGYGGTSEHLRTDGLCWRFGSGYRNRQGCWHSLSERFVGIS